MKRNRELETPLEWRQWWWWWCREGVKFTTGQGVWVCVCVNGGFWQQACSLSTGAKLVQVYTVVPIFRPSSCHFTFLLLIFSHSVTEKNAFFLLVLFFFFGNVAFILIKDGMKLKQKSKTRAFAWSVTSVFFCFFFLGVMQNAWSEFQQWNQSVMGVILIIRENPKLQLMHTHGLQINPLTEETRTPKKKKKKGRKRKSNLGRDPATRHVIWRSSLCQEAHSNRRSLSCTTPRETLEKHKPSGGYSAHSQTIKYWGCLSDLQSLFRTVWTTWLRDWGFN